MVAVTDNRLSRPLIYSRWRFGYCPAQGAALTLDPWPPGSALCPNQRTGLELLLRGEATWGLDQTEWFVCGNRYSHNSGAPDLTTHNQLWFTCILIVLERLHWSSLAVTAVNIWYIWSVLYCVQLSMTFSNMKGYLFWDVLVIEVEIYSTILGVREVLI